MKTGWFLQGSSRFEVLIVHIFLRFWLKVLSE